MYCSNCGNKIDGGFKFCTQCGLKVENMIKEQKQIEDSYKGSASNVSVNGSNVNKPNIYEVAPDMMVEKEMNKKANVMSGISLALKYLPSLFIGFFMQFFNLFSESAVYDGIIALSMLAVIASYIASFVLMIIVRVKYPKNIFGKVIMWIYIGELILGILAILFVLFILGLFFSVIQL